MASRTVKTDELKQRVAEHEAYQITLLLEGLPNDSGEVRLGDLIYELQALSSLLLSLDRAASPEHKVSTDYRVVDLRRTNPSQVTIGGTPKRGAPDVRAVVFGQPFDTINRIIAGESTGYDYDLLEDLKIIAEPVGKRLARAALVRNGLSADLTIDLHDTIKTILEPQYVAAGFLQGRVETVNVHRETNTLKLYPRVGPAKVTGHFPSRLHETVGTALGKDVRLHGIMKYRAGDPYAFAIDIETIEILPDVSELPTFYDLQGALSEVANGMTSEEWLEESLRESEKELRMLLGR